MSANIHTPFNGSFHIYELLATSLVKDLLVIGRKVTKKKSNLTVPGPASTKRGTSRAMYQDTMCPRNELVSAFDLAGVAGMAWVVIEDWCDLHPI